MTTQPDELLPCWYVKDYADGWIKFYDLDCAVKEAMETGAVMHYSANGFYPATRPTPRIDDQVDVEKLKAEILLELAQDIGDGRARDPFKHPAPKNGIEKAGIVCRAIDYLTAHYNLTRKGNR